MPQWSKRYGSGDLTQSLQDHIQKIAFTKPTNNRNQSWKSVQKQKVKNALFGIPNNIFDWSTNKHHQLSHNDFAKQQLKGFHSTSMQMFQFFHPVQHNPFFRPFEPFSEVIMHHMECTPVKHTYPSNTPICTVQLSSNITKVTHLSLCTLTMFSHHNTSKWSQFLSDHATSKSHS